jgi:hypothetical protein
MSVLRKRLDRPMFVINGGKFGGGGKTNLTLATASIALLAGLRVGIIDADAEGTRAISTRVRRPDIPVIPLLAGSKISSILDALKDRDLILFDVGAGELTNERTLVPLLSLANHVGGTAGNAAMLVCQIPHKSNVLNDMERTVDSLGDMLEMHIVQQNIDGTGAFDKLPATLHDFPRHSVPHLAPTILNMALPTGWLAADFIREGLSGYERLRGAWAWHLHRIANSNAFAHWLSIDGALPILERISRSRPRRTLPNYLSARQMTDAVIDAWSAMHDAHDSILHTSTSADIVSAVMTYRNARATVDRLLA